MTLEGEHLEGGDSGARLIRIAVLLLVATLIVAGLCSLFGRAPLVTLVWRIRLLRLASAAIVGAALAAAGMALQAMLRNPLAEPYILGISSGAGIGVMVGYATVGATGLLGWATTPALAAVGALCTCAVVYGIAHRRGRLDPYTLLLSGVIVNAFNGAIMLAIFMLVPPRTISDFAGWAMGRLTDSHSPWLLVTCGAFVAVGWGVLFLRGAALNMLGLGDDVAATGGVAVHRLRIETFVVVSLMTAAAVALAGPIGFLGLIVPHICRVVFGPDHRRLVIVCGFGGAIFLMVADTLCRTVDWFRVGEIPVGILTAMCGGPFFIYLLRRRFRGGVA